MLYQKQSFIAPTLQHNLMLVLIFSMLTPTLGMTAGVDNITCHHGRGGTKYIYVEHAAGGRGACRTIYSPNGAQFKAIAWAHSDTQKCYEVATKVAANLKQAGWDCNLSSEPVSANGRITGHRPVSGKPKLNHKRDDAKAGSSVPTSEPKTEAAKTEEPSQKSNAKPEETKAESPKPAPTAPKVESASEEELLKTIEK